MPERIFAELPHCDGLLAFTTAAPTDYRAGTETGEINRRDLERDLAPLELSWLALEHGGRVVCDPSGSSLAADAAVVTQAGHAVAFTTADCLPVIIADLANHAVAGIHAGWRGLASGVIENTVNMLLAYEQADRYEASALYAWIGPGIAQEDYEVGADVRDALLSLSVLAELSEAHDRLFLPARPGHWLADLPFIAALILTDAGLSPDAITRYPTSTFRGSHLHSARRDGELSGRMATVVGLL
ncbi:MAG: polyphenol oxidase family protein [Coriobacteriales bacterium]|jgi:YfiH family protein|nr:polyphenol oxidase family protein [Coriobacteriales bacterium]